MSIVANQRMFVEAAPVPVIERHPFVVSADKAIVHPGVLSITVIAELTHVTVELALA